LRTWRATPGEAATVARLIWEFGNWFGNSAPPEDEILASVERIMSGGDGEYFLGGGEGEAQGVLQLRFRWSAWKSAPDAWLEDLYVRDDARRSGLGRALVEAALERARERGCKRIELDVQEDNEAALRLYEACGFNLKPKGSVPTRFISRPL
jgi:ribosomal protein S18 acetylase RimI-like enzyme